MNKSSDLKILVIDDVAMIRKLVSKCLSSMPEVNEIIEAKSGMEGLTKFYINTDTDLIITDWVMPKMDGLFFINRLRDQGHQVPVILFTANGEDKIDRLDQSRIQSTLSKPFESKTLKRRVRSVLGIDKPHTTPKAPSSNIL